MTVAAAFYPLQEAVERVGGDRVEVLDLTPPGSGPHDLELTPKDLEALEGADGVVFLSKGFQPSVEKAVANLPGSVSKLDVLDTLELLPVKEGLSGTVGEVDGEELNGGFDPHVWVDPLLQSELASSVAEMIIDLDPANAADYESALETYQSELGALDGEFSKALRTCASRTIVTSHRAFAYLSDRYDLDQVAIAGISPDEEPDPRSLQAVADRAEADEVEVIFFESRVPKDLSETVAREIGAQTDFLDPVETITRDELDDGVDYSSIQRRNLASLVKGLRCTS